MSDLEDSMYGETEIAIMYLLSVLVAWAGLFGVLFLGWPNWTLVVAGVYGLLNFSVAALARRMLMITRKLEWYTKKIDNMEEEGEF